MPKRRVVITGLGAMCGLGENTPAIWKNIVAGKSAFHPIDQSSFPAKLRFENAGFIQNLDLSKYLTNKEQDVLDRFAQFGLIAAKEAVTSSKMNWDDENAYTSGVIIGTSIGGEETHDYAFKELYWQRKKRIHPLMIPKIMPNSLNSYLCMEFGIKGPAYTISSACSSGNHAIGNAFWMIRNGLCSTVLAGASESPLHYGFLKAWEAIRVISSDTCRPFSANRKGIILGEGGAVLVLESLENALVRGAPIYAEIIGFGMSADGFHLTKPDPKGAEMAMLMAIKDADIAVENIDYINAHGTGTKVSDAAEIAAVKTVFGKHVHSLAISSTKSMHGHLLGGAGALEAVITSLAIQNDMIPPTANYEERDADCDIDVVPNKARKKEIQYAMSNTFAFGGLNAVLVFKKYVL